MCGEGTDTSSASGTESPSDSAAETRAEDERTLDFIRAMIEADLRTGKWDGRVVTRFPPEPNGYLHIGHAKALALSFSVAEEYGGTCHLRFDDTNPVKEDQEYVDAMKRDIRWLGFDWDDNEFYASDYFEQLYEWAEQLVRQGDAYVCDLSAEELSEQRGTLTEPGTESPYRDRGVEENLDLLRRMRAGEFPDGSRTLRAKIDMASPNLNLRDPVMYRVLHVTHHRTGDTWCIYPSYDWTHGQSDSIEGITHSLCSLEFANNRPLYNWFLERLGVYHPEQTEFARMNVSHTVTSKRKLIRLVDEGHVLGWDDPRMPTLSGMRRRGYPPAAVRAFLDGVGVAKRENTIEIARLEHAVREELNRTAPRVLAVLRPLRVVIENYPVDKVEYLEAVNNPEDPSAGTRELPFTRELFIEQSDFMEDPPRKFFRLAPGREVRLRYGYFITCTHVIKDDEGNVIELRCTYDPATRGGDAPDGRKVKGTIHWVSAAYAIPAEVRLYDHLFTKFDAEEVDDGGDFVDNVNPESVEVLHDCQVEPTLADAQPGDTFQFERTGYFTVDPESEKGHLVFNRTVTLRDSWAKQQAKA
ncbi:MAG: glutamine--tRNA ligase/YqeY domain fusion protein [Anaerolineae bacterium]